MTVWGVSAGPCFGLRLDLVDMCCLATMNPSSMFSMAGSACHGSTALCTWGSCWASTKDRVCLAGVADAAYRGSTAVHRGPAAPGLHAAARPARVRSHPLLDRLAWHVLQSAGLTPRSRCPTGHRGEVCLPPAKRHHAVTASGEEQVALHSMLSACSCATSRDVHNIAMHLCIKRCTSCSRFNS